MELTQIDYALASLAAFTGETLGAIFGGGSFVIQPALLALGVTPHMAVANDIASSAFSGLFYVLYSLRNQKIDTAIACWMVPAMAVGAVTGGLILSHIPEYISGWIIFVICCVGFIYTLFHINKSAISEERKKRESLYGRALAVLVGVGLGMYDGVSGAGSGILVITALVVIFGGNMKSILMMSNLLATVSLAVAGLTFWSLGLLDAGLMLVMVPAASLAGVGAAKIVHVVSEKNLRIVYVCIVGGLISYLAYKYIKNLFGV